MTLRTRIVAAQSVLSLLLIALPHPAAAAGKATLVFRNACESQSSSNGFGGPLPEAPMLLGSSSTCTPFTTRDPLTQETGIVKKGDVLDIALVLLNPDAESITRVRSWIAYDPTVLTDGSVQLSSAFPTATPGETDFSPQQAYIKIGGGATAGSQKGTSIVVARIRMTVADTDGSSTVLSFYDAGDDPKKHTVAITGTGTNERNVLASPLGSLVIRFTDSVAPATSSAPARSSAASSSSAAASVASSASAASAASAQASSGVFGGAVSVSSSSASSAASSLSPTSASAGSASSSLGNLQFSSSAASLSGPFAQLQVRNLRVGTEGTNAYLSWDTLSASQLIAYNVYYGTVSGQYIQRRTLDKTTDNTTIRNLPQNLTYYFAVRGVSSTGAETDYSQEVAVTIGNPATSTNPLGAGSSSLSFAGVPTPNSPYQSNVTAENKPAFAHPGVIHQPAYAKPRNVTETGVSSTLALLAIASAAIGTFFAFRRQLIASSGSAL